MLVHEAAEPLAVNGPRGRVGHADGRAGARHVAQDGEFAEQVTGGDHGEKSDPAIGCGGGDLHPSAEDAVHSLWWIALDEHDRPGPESVQPSLPGEGSASFWGDAAEQR